MPGAIVGLGTSDAPTEGAAGFFEGFYKGSFKGSIGFPLRLWARKPYRSLKGALVEPFSPETPISLIKEYTLNHIRDP